MSVLENRLRLGRRQWRRYLAGLESLAQRLGADERRLRAGIELAVAGRPDFAGEPGGQPAGQPARELAGELTERHGKLARSVAAIDTQIAEVGAAPGASCIGPAYEFAFELDHLLRKRGLRHRVPITFVTPEPFLGHMGMGGAGTIRQLLEGALDERDIGPGEKFAEAELLGCPLRVTVGRRTLGAGEIEVQVRRGREGRSVPIDGASEAIAELWRGLP